MMQERHKNKLQYFNEQVKTTERYVIPYIEQVKTIKPGLTVLEIGCAEGGNLKPFLDMGCNCTGVDLSAGKIEKGMQFYENHLNGNNLILICQNIYNWDNNQQFDVIFLRDVIEHIPNQLYFMDVLKKYLKKDSVVFFGFPPWQNPFGGHQQVCKSPVLSKLPWFHLLPGFLSNWYKNYLANQIRKLMN